MIEENLLPSWDTITILVVVTAVIAYGLTWVARGFLQGWEKAMHAKAAWFWNGTIRLLSVLLGSGTGALLLTSLGGLCAWGAAIGAGGGALSTAVVAVVKKRIRAKAGGA